MWNSCGTRFNYIWHSVSVIAALFTISSCGEDRDILKDTFANVSALGTYSVTKDESQYVKSISLRQDSSFLITILMDECGETTFSGKWSLDSEAYRLRESDYSKWAALDRDLYYGAEKLQHAFRTVSLHFTGDIHSADCPGNGIVGIPYRLGKPGICGNRNYLSVDEKVLVVFSEDKDGVRLPSIDKLIVVEYGCQESSGKRFTYGREMIKK